LEIDPAIALAGLLVGFTVGLTGMGGGALMTPILVLVFGVQPLTAISSDLVTSFVMKPIGAGVHVRRRTANLSLVKWLVAGSVPAAFAGVLLLKQLGDGAQVQQRIRWALGAALLLAAGSILAKATVQARRPETGPPEPPGVRPVATLLVGVLGGVVVGMTSVGSGSLVIVLLLVLYPTLTSAQLVGTDLVQAIPLVGSAALGHLLFGDFRLDLTTSLLVGSLPGVYLGARVSSRARDAVIRPVLALVLLASGLKLLGVGTAQLILILLVPVMLALPVWGVLDAIAHAPDRWEAVPVSRRLIVGLQGAGALFGVGFLAALVYFRFVRPALLAVTSAPPEDPVAAEMLAQASEG
jgi:uncharacterized protein